MMIIIIIMGERGYGVIFESSLSPSHDIIKAQICRSIRAVWPTQSDPSKGYNVQILLSRLFLKCYLVLVMFSCVFYVL